MNHLNKSIRVIEAPLPLHRFICHAYNCEPRHDSGDADHHIIQKAVESAASCNIVLDGNGMDRLSLLCYHVSL